MPLLEKIDRFNSRVQNAADLTNVISDRVIWICIAAALIFATWWAPRHFHWPSFHGWMWRLQMFLTVICLITIWQMLRDLVAVTKPKPKAPPPYRPERW